MIIHLLAPKDQSKWHELWQHCYNIWKTSPYTIKIWNDEDIDQLLKEDDEEFFTTLDTLPPIYKFDYVRYIILEKFGGSYFDMDVEIIKDFFPLLDKKLPYFMEGTGGTLVENSIIIDSIIPNPHFWNRFKKFAKRKVIENLDKCHLSYNVLHYVGPWMMTEMLIKNFDKDLDYSILGYEQFANPKNSISFSRHYQTHFWNDRNMKKRITLYPR